MHYEDLIERLRKGTGLPILQSLMNEAADAIEDLSKPPIIQMRNDLSDDDRKRLVDLLDQNCGYVAEEPATVVADRIEAAGFLRPVPSFPPWISVEERLPETGEAVLVLAFEENVRDYSVVHLTYDDEDEELEPNFWWVDEIDNWLPLESFTHWMELPEPPKEGV